LIHENTAHGKSWCGSEAHRGTASFQREKTQLSGLSAKTISRQDFLSSEADVAEVWFIFSQYSRTGLKHHSKSFLAMSLATLKMNKELHMNYTNYNNLLLDHWPHIQMPAEMDSLVVAMAK
jgi:hypothetical protein